MMLQVRTIHTGEQNASEDVFQDRDGGLGEYMVEMSLLDPSAGTGSDGLTEFQTPNGTILLTHIRELGLELVRALEDTAHGAQLAAVDVANQVKICCRFLKSIHDWLSTFYRARLLEIIRWVLPESLASALAKYLGGAASIAADAGALATEASALAAVSLALANMVGFPMVLECLKTITQAMAKGVSSGSPAVCVPAVALSIIALWLSHRRGRGDRVLQAEMREKETKAQLLAAEAQLKDAETRVKEAEAKASAAEAKARAAEEKPEAETCKKVAEAMARAAEARAERDGNIQDDPWTATHLGSRRSRSQLQSA